MIVMEHRTKLYFLIYATKGAGIKKPLKAKANKGFGMLRDPLNYRTYLSRTYLLPLTHSDTVNTRKTLN